MIVLDADWLRAHPLPPIDTDTDKNKRGRLLIAGSSTLVPGALLLSGEAGYRAGAGKVQLGVPHLIACDVGVRMPEAAVFGLSQNDTGELGPEPEALTCLVERCDCLVLGPGMGSESDAGTLLRSVLSLDDGEQALLLDAAAIAICPDLAAELCRWKGPLVLTPHPGEMASLMGCNSEEVEPDMALMAARKFQATVLLKGPRTMVASPDGSVLEYPGGGPGMATGGSGDVLAGIIGGLLSRGADARTAAAWGVWTHGEAGRRLASEQGPIGFLARELLPLVPGLIYGKDNPASA